MRIRSKHAFTVDFLVWCRFVLSRCLGPDASTRRWHFCFHGFNEYPAYESHSIKSFSYNTSIQNVFFAFPHRLNRAFLLHHLEAYLLVFSDDCQSGQGQTKSKDSKIFVLYVCKWTVLRVSLIFVQSSCNDIASDEQPLGCTPSLSRRKRTRCTQCLVNDVSSVYLSCQAVKSHKTIVKLYPSSERR